MIVRQFDTPKNEADAALDEAEKVLLELANGTDLEDDTMHSQLDSTSIDDDQDIPDDDDGWCDEHDLLTAEELDALNLSVKPVRLILVKVSGSFFQS
jgi:hypothetical protein